MVASSVASERASVRGLVNKLTGMLARSHNHSKKILLLILHTKQLENGGEGINTDSGIILK